MSESDTEIPLKVRNGVLSDRTLIPIGIVVSIMSVFMLGTWWLKGQLTDTTYELKSIKSRLDSIENRVEGNIDDRFRARDFDAWVKLLQLSNKTLDVPERIR